MKLIEAFNEVQKLKVDEVPWEVKRVFPTEGSRGLTLEVVGSEVSFGEDFVSIEQARTAVNFLVNQLGGTVKWKK